MADQQPVYTGATYNADIYKKPDESITDYMIRLSRLRSQGVLGGGGMLDVGATPTVTTPDYASPETDLGILKKNVYQSGDSDYVAPKDTRSAEQKLRDAVAHQSGAETNWADFLLGVLPTGLFGTVVSGAMNASEKAAIEKQLSERYSPEQVKEIMDNPKALADYYASGAMINDPLAMNAKDAGTSVGYVSDNVLSFLGDITGIKPYGEVSAPKVYGLGDNWNTGSMFNQQSITNRLFGDVLGSIDFVDGKQINTFEDLMNLDTIGNTGTGNYNADTGMYTIGTSANRNADGSYTIGTSANKNADGSYTIGTRSGSSPIAATNDSKDSNTTTSDTGWGLDTGGYSWW